ncbi:MAG: metallophosphoesterase [Candidatus Aminicenantes bacterium]|nr:metallophosphoesterase [Candidatus Aminicenantes bacterium]
MASGVIRILFLADTHLGFDLPFKPRIEQRRRGPDFFANFEKALEPALKGEVDAVVHGGDLLYRSKVPAALVNMAFEPLKKVADRGVPIYLVPGNHERSAIPFRLLAEHPNIHIFHRAFTFILTLHGFTLAMSGFPYVRENVREKFPGLLAQTGYRKIKADCNLLCMHHCVEGAAVGEHNFVFRGQDFVVGLAEIPAAFAAVLSGHIHRFQVVTKDLPGRTILVPVFYPGAIERTSFAEKNEKKGYLTLEIATSGPDKGSLRGWQFHQLPARPMREIILPAAGKTGAELESGIKNILEKLPADSIVKLKIIDKVEEEALPVLRAASLRSIAPPTMNVSVAVPSLYNKNRN